MARASFFQGLAKQLFLIHCPGIAPPIEETEWLSEKDTVANSSCTDLFSKHEGRYREPSSQLFLLVTAPFIVLLLARCHVDSAFATKRRFVFELLAWMHDKKIQFVQVRVYVDYVVHGSISAIFVDRFKEIRVHRKMAEKKALAFSAKGRLKKWKRRLEHKRDSAWMETQVKQWAEGNNFRTNGKKCLLERPKSRGGKGRNAFGGRSKVRLLLSLLRIFFQWAIPCHTQFTSERCPKNAWSVWENLRGLGEETNFLCLERICSKV